MFKKSFLRNYKNKNKYFLYSVLLFFKTKIYYVLKRKIKFKLKIYNFLILSYYLRIILFVYNSISN